MLIADGLTLGLKSKVALVTGGSRGIGRAICLGLAAAGAKVVVSSRTEDDTSAGTQFEKYASGTIGQTVRHIVEQGGTAIDVRCDISDAADIQRLVALAFRR